MNKRNTIQLALAGVTASIAMSAVAMMAPFMGMPPMNPANMLGAMMGNNILLGWAAHLMIGVTLAYGYGTIRNLLPGSLPLSGALYALAPWLVAQLMVMPMMGKGVFSGSLVLAMGSLMGHLVYGAVLGTMIFATRSIELDSDEARALNSPS